MVPWRSFTFVMAKIQCKEKRFKNSTVKINFATGFLYMFLHQIEGVEFTYDNLIQTFLSTLYIENVTRNHRAS